MSQYIIVGTNKDSDGSMLFQNCHVFYGFDACIEDSKRLVTAYDSVVIKCFNDDMMLIDVIIVK